MAKTRTQTFGEKVSFVMNHFGFTDHGGLKEFSDKTKISTQMLWNITNEKTKNPSVFIASQILKAFPSLSSDWLMRDQGEVEVKKVAKEEIKVSQTKQVDNSPSSETDRTLQEKVLALESTLKDKNQIIALQNQLLAKK